MPDLSGKSLCGIKQKIASRHFWRVKPEGIHLPLNRLIYINKEGFKFLRGLRSCFLKRIKGFFVKEAESEKFGKESFNKSNIRQYLEEGNGKICLEYEASKIREYAGFIIVGVETSEGIL